jgi:hypothetical protein
MIRTSIEDGDQLLLPRLFTALSSDLGGTAENAQQLTSQAILIYW